jgi:hypothetical protein
VRFRNTVILAAIVAALGAYLYFVERPAVEREAEKKTLLDFEPEAAVGIVLEYPDRSIELAKVDGAWKITAPRELEADQNAVQNLLKATAEAEEKRVADEKPADIAKFGLSPPAATIRVELQGGNKLPALAVGGSTPIGFNAYVRRGDEPAVLLTAGTFQAGVKKSLEDLRDKTILRFDDAQVRTIRLQPAAGAPTVLQRDGEDWKITEPIQAAADPNAVKGLLGSLRSMRARGFADPTAPGEAPSENVAAEAPAELADRGFSPPRLKVDVGLESGEPQTIELGGEKAGEGEKLLYVRVPGRETIYEVGSHVQASIDKTADDLRDKTVLAVDETKVTAVEVARSDGEGFTLERRGEGWGMAGADAPVRESVASRLVEDVVLVKGASIASENGDLAASGLDVPPLKITIRSPDGVLGELHLGSQGERFFVAAQGAPLVFEIQDYVYRRFDKRRSDLLEDANEAAAAPQDGAPPGPAEQGDIGAEAVTIPEGGAEAAPGSP